MSMNAVLVELSFGSLGITKEDKQVTAATEASLNLEGKKAGKWQKKLLTPEATAAIAKACSQARKEHDALTLKWSKGVGLLAVAGQEEYTRRMERCRARWMTAVDAFCGDYAGVHIPAARSMLGATFNSADYPPADRIRSYFSFRYHIFPVPDASHFDTRLREVYAGQLTTEVDRRVADACSEMWERLLDPVRKLAARLVDPEAIFRDSLVVNISEIVDVMPALNLTGDTRINQASERIKQELANLDPEKLRKEGAVRARAVAAANSILGSFGAMGQRSIMVEAPEPELPMQQAPTPTDDEPMNERETTAPSAEEEPE